MPKGIGIFDETSQSVKAYGRYLYYIRIAVTTISPKNLRAANLKRQFGFQKSYRNIAFIMGATKSYEFSVKENKLARVAKALGHPARIAILNLLAKRQTCVCGDIVDELPLSQSTVSQHLKELKEAGLITGEIEGAKVCYCIDAKEWKAAQVVLNQMFETYKGGSKCC